MDRTSLYNRRQMPFSPVRQQPPNHKKSGQLFRIVRFSSGRRTRTSGLRVMSPTSYQLLHPAIYLPCPLPTVSPSNHSPKQPLPDRPALSGPFIAFACAKISRIFLFSKSKSARDLLHRRISYFLSAAYAEKNYFRAPATISARSRTSPFVPRPMAFLQSGQAVTITSAPVASNSPATARAICTC